MSDKRLIDANELLEKLGERYLATDPSDPEQLGYLNARIIVRNQPTIDAVEVVRCRDCRNSQKLKTCADQVYCMVWKSNPRTDGYCYLGAKMDGGANDEKS